MEVDWIFCCECGKRDDPEGVPTVVDQEEKNLPVEDDGQPDSMAGLETSDSEISADDLSNGEETIAADPDQDEQAAVDEMGDEADEGDPDSSAPDDADVDEIIESLETGDESFGTEDPNTDDGEGSSEEDISSDNTVNTDGNGENDPDGDDAGKKGGKFRNHGLSTGILIVWLVAVAAICLVIGGVGGATWQKGNDERAFEIERNAFNDKIATLESKAEEDQKELAELREFRKKLEDLVVEYMVLDANNTAANGTSGQAANANEKTGATGNSNTANGKESSEAARTPTFFEMLFGGGDDTSNANANSNANSNSANSGKSSGSMGADGSSASENASGEEE